MYLYQSHMGGLYWEEESLPWENLYCETCGDSDTKIGYFESAIDVLKYMADDIDAQDGHGGLSIEYVLEELFTFDDCPKLKEAIDIVKNNRTEESENEEC